MLFKIFSTFLPFSKLIYPLLSMSLYQLSTSTSKQADRKSLIFPHQSYTYLPLHSAIRVRHLCCFLKADSFPSDLPCSPSPSCSWLLFLKFLFLSFCFVYFSFSTSLFSWALSPPSLKGSFTALSYFYAYKTICLLVSQKNLKRLFTFIVIASWITIYFYFLKCEIDCEI